MIREPEPLDHRLRIGRYTEIPEGMDALRRIGRTVTGQLEVEPVLGVQGGRGLGHDVRPVFREPQELRPHLAGRETGAGAFEVATTRRSSAQVGREAACTGVEPDQGGPRRFAGGIDQPGSVALGRDADRGRAGVELRHGRREATEGRGRIGPGPCHVLLGTDAVDRLVLVGQCETADLLTLLREGDRLDHRGPGVDADQQIAGHQPSSPCRMATPFSASKRCRSAAARS